MKITKISFSKSRFIAQQEKMVRDGWKYATDHVVELEVLLGVSIVLGLLKTLPYFNIYLSPNIIFFVLFVCASLLFQFSRRVILTVTLLLFFVSFLFLMRNNEAGAEEVGNLIYFLLWYVVILYGKALWEDLKKQS